MQRSDRQRPERKRPDGDMTTTAEVFDLRRDEFHFTGETHVKHLTSLAVAGMLAATILPASAADITGAGSTFVYPVLAKWADQYRKDTDVGLNYQSIGSGGGIKQITAKTVTFGATDMPLTPEDVAKNNFVQFPVINGSVVPLLNLPGIKPGDITLDGPTMSKMFL